MKRAGMKGEKMFLQKIKRKLLSMIFVFVVTGCGKTGLVSFIQNPPETRIVDNSADVGYYMDMVIDDRGFPHFSYMEKTGGEVVSKLKYARLVDSGEWQVEIVDEGELNEREGLYSKILYDPVSLERIIVYREEKTGVIVQTRLKVARSAEGQVWRISVIRDSADIGTFGDVGYGIATVLLSDRNVGIAFFEGQQEGDFVFYNVMYMEIDIFNQIVVGPEVVKEKVASVSVKNKKTVKDVERALTSGMPLSIDILTTFEDGEEVVHIFYYNPSNERAEHAFKVRGADEWKYEALEWSYVTGEIVLVEPVSMTDSNNNPVTRYIGTLKGRALQDKDRTVVYRNAQPLSPDDWNFYAGGKKIEILRGYSPTDVYSIDYINTHVVSKRRNGPFIRAVADSANRLYAVYEDKDARVALFSTYTPGKWWDKPYTMGNVSAEGGYSIALDSLEQPVVTFYESRYGNLVVAHRMPTGWMVSNYLSLDFAGYNACIRKMPDGDRMGIGATIYGGHAGLGGTWGMWLIYIPYYGVF